MNAMTNFSLKLLPRVLSATALAATSASVLAVDGVVLIDQNRILSGNVTPGDAPGFPLTISQPGSYRLAGNLTVPNANTSAIEITANGVTLDLNGFVIRGVTACSYDSQGSSTVQCTNTGTGVGVSFPGGSEIGPNGHVAVTNGTISGMGSHGVRLNTVSGNTLVSGVRVIGNGGSGIIAAGEVSDCIADGNGSHGIAASGVVRNNVAVANGEDGLRIISLSGAILGNFSSLNGGFGLRFLSGQGGGYGQNVITANRSGTVLNGLQLSGNVCNNSTVCP
ncbi:hypothetical protein ACPOLB_00700 [Rubrivivax sp. RP6-9]|uniref:hypothetical protein n=1 Tax=Rubrivivax sp. RP6-9 TaxID=3415750 RepID=UPI003CC6300D